MIKKSKGTILIYQAENLTQQSDIDHFFTTRTGGVSVEVFRSLNFGTQHGEAENMTTNLQILSASFQFDQSRIILPKQTHSDRIVVITTNYSEQILDETDALITNLTSVCLAVKTADCVPILLFDPVKKAIAAVHSGWRGTVQNIIGKTIKKMNQTYGTNPNNLVAAIGPCISQENYEVGNDVFEYFQKLFPEQESILRFEPNEKKALLNLTEANKRLLIESGVKEGNIECSGICTFSNQNDFYSARRDGQKTGRMLNGIMLK
jgi:YfiH family protein